MQKDSLSTPIKIEKGSQPEHIHLVDCAKDSLNSLTQDKSAKQIKLTSVTQLAAQIYPFGGLCKGQLKFINIR